MSKRAQAQQERRSRERDAQQAAQVAEAIAEASPDVVEPQAEVDAPMPKVDHSERMQQLEALRQKPDDMDEYIREETEEVVPTQEAPEPEATPEVAPQVAPEVVAEVPETVTVKIDGQEMQVAKSEVDAVGSVSAYQMLKAAEKRLEQANREKHELTQILQQARQMIQPQTPVKPPEEVLREKVQQIQFGTPEEAAQALQDILTTQRVNPNDIITQAVSQMERKSAMNQFVSRNQDIMGNPLLAKLAVIAEHDKLSKSPPSDWNKFYSDLEVEIRNGIGRPATTPQPAVSTQQTDQPTSGPVADKLARKANIVNLPVAAGRIAAPEDPKPLTREDRLNLLRKSRGQPVG